MISKETVNKVLSLLALVPVGLISLGYIFWGNIFAKIYVQLSFIKFPVFIGEILLGWCILLLILYFLKNPPKIDKPFIFLLVYLAWLAFKAIHGYRVWGPLAFRHAALFYYPLFSVVGFVFFYREFFTKNTILVLLTMIIAILAAGKYNPYWTTALSCLGIILIIGIKDRRWAIFLSLALAIVIPYVALFETARMMFVGNIASIMLVMAGIFYVLEIRALVKALIFILVLSAVSIGFYRSYVIGASNRTFATPGEIMKEFREDDRRVQAQEKDYRYEPRTANLFHQKGKNNDPALHRSFSLHFDSNMPNRDDIHDMRNSAPRPLDIVARESTGNVVFRLFIWRDLIEDWNVQKPLWGVDFGKPFLSRSLMILHWAETEWSRDGWIEPHNSYLNMLYRAGIVGAILLVLIAGSFIWFVQEAFFRWSWVMILLAAVLLGWLVAANFLVILESAYTAIPIWTLAGMAGAYALKR